MASEEDTYRTITLKGTPITDLRVTDIKKELEKRGLSKSGSKTQLSDRLKAQLLLEKLQQDAAQSSGDEHEGKVPNMALQRDDKAGQSEFVRQYLQQQQRNLEIQMEMKKQVEEERKLKSADESSADECKDAAGSQAEKADMTSATKFKDDSTNAPAREGDKMSRPAARKSSRNSSKAVDNCQEGESVIERSESPVPECDRLRDRTRSGSSSSSRSPSSDKYSQSRRGRSSRGRAKRGGVRRGGQQNRSRSSSSSTSPEVIPKKNQRHRNNSSSRSRSKSPQIVSPEAPTRRSNTRSSTVQKATPDHVQEKELPHDGGDKLVEKTETAEHFPSAPKRRWRKKPSIEGKTVEPEQLKDEDTKSTSVAAAAVHRADSTNERKQLESELSSTNEKQKVAAKVQSEPESIETESSGTLSEHLKQPMAIEKGAEPEPASKDRITEAKVEEKLPGRSSLSKAVPREIVTGAVSSTTTPDQARNAVTEKVKGNEPTSVKGDNAKETISTEQASRDGNKELFSENKDTITEKVELDKNKLVSKEKKNEVFDRLSKVIEEKAQTSVVEQTDSTVKNDNKDLSSPSRQSQRRRSYSSDSSSVESRSRSKSPIRKKQSRSGSSSSSSSNSRSSSSSSSTDVSSPEKSKVISQAQAHGKDELSRPPSHSPERVVQDREKIESTKRDAPFARNTDYQRKDDKTQALTTILGTQKLRSQEEKQNQPDKEQECRPNETKRQQEMVHTDLDASRATDSVSNADADEETVAKKGIKKRKWGSKTSKAAKTTKRTSSMEISSDVLKNLIGDVKLTETVFEMETEVVNTLDYDENEEDRRDVKVKRNVIQDVIQSPPEEEAKTEQEDARRVETREEYSPEPAEIPSEPEKKIIKLSTAAPKVKSKLKEGKKKKDEKKKRISAGKENKEDTLKDKDSREKVFATTRSSKPLLPVVDEPEPVSSSQSPARYPPDRVIHIANLVRPFTVGQLKELLKRSGELDDEYFWINAIKSHCLAAYKSQEDAVAARAALHGTRWPQSNPKILFVDFTSIEDVMLRKSEGDMPLPALIKRPPVEEQKKLKEHKVDEEKEKKQKGREQKEKGRVEREKVSRDKREVDRDKRDRRDQKREAEKKNPVREWDRDKIQQLSRSRSKSKESEKVNRRSRSKDREQRKRRDPSKEKKVDDRRREKKLKDTKAEEEPPAKLLDDLFRKTKATPCIYWLPLTEEQAQQRIVKKLEMEKERQKRIAALEEREKEELKKRETARLERQREREKPRDKSRERERDKGRQERSRSYSRSRSRRRR